MKVFSYTVKDKTEKILKGSIEAESESALVSHFHNEQCIIFSIAEIKDKRNKRIKGKVKTEDLVIFSRQFTTLIESGIPVVESLGILKEQMENVYFKSVIEVILKDVKEGTSLSAALAKHKKVFPDIYLSMVKAAEVSGSLADILDRVSVYLEKSSALTKKVMSAFYYPIIIVVMAIAITSFLLFKVIPTFKGIYDSLGGTLPLPTQILISIADNLTRKESILIILALGFGGFFLFKKYVSTPRGKKQYHQFILKIPVFGNLLKKIAIAKFARTFATLVKSGVSIVKCLEIVANTSGNKVIEDAVIESKKSIQNGETISAPLEKTGVFPPMVTRMISVGEKSGRLEGMLSKIAQFYEEQTDAMVAGLSSLIEPVIIAFLGIVVGGIVVSLFLPILKITQQIGGMG